MRNLDYSRLCSLLLGSIVLMIVGIVLFLVAEDVKAADAVITWNPHPAGAAVDIRIQLAPTSTGPWTAISPDSPGTDSKRVHIYSGTPGEKLCARAKAVRIADSVSSLSWSNIACDTTSSPPANVTGTVIKLP